MFVWFYLLPAAPIPTALVVLLAAHPGDAGCDEFAEEDTCDDAHGDVLDLGSLHGDFILREMFFRQRGQVGFVNTHEIIHG